MTIKTIRRYTDRQRMNHWLVVLLFGLAGFSGLSLFHPSLFFLTQFFGGPQWTRIVHPYLGVAVVLLFLLGAAQLWRANLWRREDNKWLSASGHLVLRGDASKMPPAGKYNAGQKLVFWLMVGCLLALLLTGLLFWQAWFAAIVPIGLQRVAVLLHALAAFVMSLAVVVHIYAAIWVKGTMRAMTQGDVSAGWAKRHHLLWYRKKVSQGSRGR
ncbi:MAG: formate dehydrogenase subunit gamma [Burkholderiaceae bacterium]|jgi:formate dehydrogenase subunit gamma|nr:formate dehydrogenase subunit gamma [Burkholderiaceae bacterium]